MFGLGQQKVSSNDSRIMLQCLVIEAAKYNHQQHQRRKLGSPLPEFSESSVTTDSSDCGLTPGQSGRDDPPSFCSSEGVSLGSEPEESPLRRRDSGIFPSSDDASWTVTSSSLHSAPESETPPPATHRDNAAFAALLAQQADQSTPDRRGDHQQGYPEYFTEEWEYLWGQVNHHYDTCGGRTPEDRFLRAKCKLTPLFLWNIDMAVEKDLDNDAQSTLESIAERHRRRLARLEPGQLFF